MTDKEKQYLKAKIGELQEEAFDKNMNFLSSYHEGGYNALCKVENIIASMQDEPKKCMYSEDKYTDEDRKVLCEGCEEKCEFNKKKESVDEDFLSLVDKEARELWKEINSGNDFSIVDSFNQFYGICMQVAESTVEWQKNPQEPVSEFLNTESMIESYKQRLISQANGMKNSPLIDMCLASYKHGINETLDTLNLSNVERIVKNWKEPVSEKLEDAAYSFARKDSKGISNPANFYYIIADKARIFKAGAKWQKEKDNEEKDLPLK